MPEKSISLAIHRPIKVTQKYAKQASYLRFNEGEHQNHGPTLTLSRSQTKQ